MALGLKKSWRRRLIVLSMDFDSSRKTIRKNLFFCVVGNRASQGWDTDMWSDHCGAQGNGPG